VSSRDTNRRRRSAHHRPRVCRSAKSLARGLRSSGIRSAAVRTTIVPMIHTEIAAPAEALARGWASWWRTSSPGVNLIRVPDSTGA
jgi:hypothetical protein